MAQKTYVVEQIAEFALRPQFEFDEEAKDRLKMCVLDAVGCAIGALSAGPVQQIRSVTEELGGAEKCTFVGGGKSAPDRVTLVNGCLVRYLDFMDNFLIKGEVCHPSDNFAAMLAAAEYAGRDGSDLLIATAVAYEVQCRLLAGLPTMRAGLNYTTPLAFSVAAGVSRLLGLDAGRTAHALALAGVDSVSLAVIQAEPVSQWKGLASGEVASRALHNTLLAAKGITGTLGVFDGPYGLEHLVNAKVEVDWSKQQLTAGKETSIKRYNAEFQSQAAVDAAVELHGKVRDPGDIEAITLEVPKGAYNVIGGGSYGPKDECHIKEQADHNLKYLVAVALLDGDVWPEQFATERIERADVQTLLRKVDVKPKEEFTAALPEEVRASLKVQLADGSVLDAERKDYPGFYKRPMSWDDVIAKFRRLTAPFAEESLQGEIIACVRDIESVPLNRLTELLAQPRAGLVPAASR